MSPTRRAEVTQSPNQPFNQSTNQPPRLRPWLLALALACLWLLWTGRPAAAQSSSDKIPRQVFCQDSPQVITSLPGGDVVGIIGEPVLNWDGQWLAFWSTNDLDGGRNADNNIEMFRKPATAAAIYTQIGESLGSILGGFNLSPSISADGRRVAFFSDRDLDSGQPGKNSDGNFEIFLATFGAGGGATIRQITDTRGSANIYPSIDAAGNRIAFASDDAGLTSMAPDEADANFEIVLAEVGATAVTFRQITPGKDVTNDRPSINAAGNRIAYMGGIGDETDIYLWDSTFAAPLRIADSGISLDPDIDAAGNRIAYVLTDGIRVQIMLFTIGADPTEGSSLPITPLGSASLFRDPAISDDGMRVAYVVDRGTAGVAVRIFDDATKPQQAEVSDGSGNGEQPTLSGDGTAVGFIGLGDAVTDVDISGSKVYRSECPIADLRLALAQPISATVGAGNTLIYSFRVTNLGPSTAPNVRFTYDRAAQPLPPGVVFSDTLSSPDCVESPAQIVCDLGSLAEDDFATVNIGWFVQPEAPLGTVVSNHYVQADATDRDLDNNALDGQTTNVVELSRLGMDKRASSPTVTAGGVEPLVYTAIITNAGPSRARSVIFTDTLPAGVTLFGTPSITVPVLSNPTCSAPPPMGPVVCTVGDIPVGEQATIIYRVTANASAPASVTNRAEAWAASGAVVDSETTTVLRPADLRVAKAGPAAMVAGTRITYTLTVTNAGPANAAGVRVADSLPASFTFQAAGSSSQCSGAGQDVGCTLGAMLPAAVVSLTLVADIRADAPAATITNTAVVTLALTGNRGDPQPANNRADLASAVRREADLAVQKDVSRVDPDVLEPITYTVVVTNRGPSLATGVVIRDRLPANMTYLGHQVGAGAVYTPTSGLWAIGQLAVGQRATLTIQARAERALGGQNVVNTASVFAADQADPAPGNDSDSAAMMPQRADLVLTKLDAPDPVIAGERLTYTLRITNTGPSLARAVRLTDTLPAGAGFVSAPNCARSGGQVTCSLGNLDVGQSVTRTVIITHTATGVLTNTARASSLTPDLVDADNVVTATTTVHPAVPASLTYEQQPANGMAFPAGTVFTPTITVAIRDRFGNIVDAGVNAVATAITLAASEDTGAPCAGPARSELVNNVAATAAGMAAFPDLNFTARADIYLTALHPDPAVATACSNLLKGEPDDAVKLVFLTGPFTTTAGIASDVFTVQRQDPYGNPNTAQGAITVGLATSSAPSGAFRDAADSADITSVVIPQGSSTANFRYRDTRAGAPVITASAGALTPAAQAQAIAPAAASKLVYTTPPLVLTAGVTSTAITVQRQDPFGNPNTAQAGIAVNLATSSVLSGAFRNTADTAAISSVTIPQGSSDASFLYRDTLAGSPALTATSGALTPAVQVETVQPAAAHKLVYLTAAQVLTAGVTSELIAVQRQDVFGNPTTAGGITVGLATSSVPSGTFRNAANTANITSVAISAGQSQASLRYRDTMAGTPMITGTAGSLLPAVQVATILPDTAKQLVITTSPITVTAGLVSDPFTVERQDQFGNRNSADPAITVDLATSDVVSSTFRNAASPSTVITQVVIAAGAYSADFRYRDLRFGPKVITATSAGLTDATRTITVTPGAAQLVYILSESKPLTAGVVSDLIEVARLDIFGNPSRDAAIPLTLATSSDLSGTFRHPVTTTMAITQVVIPTGEYTTTFRYRDTLAGSPVITVSSGPLIPAVQTQAILPAAASKLVYLTPPFTETAGVTSPVITVQRQDLFGNPNTAQDSIVVTLTASSAPSGAFRDVPDTTTLVTVTIPQGDSTASFRYRDELAGSPTLTASAPGLMPGVQVETILPAAASKLVFETLPFTLTAGEISTLIVVARRDQFGNANLADPAITVTLTTSSVLSGTFRDADDSGTAITSVEIPTGEYTATFRYRDELAGSPVITAASPALAPAVQTLTVEPGDANKLVFSSPAFTETAGVTSTVITVQRQDEFGNPNTATVAITVDLTTSSVLFGTFVDPANPTAVVTVTIAQGSSDASFRYRDELAGSPTITASSGALTPAAQTETILPANTSKLVFTSPAFTETAGITSTQAITVQRQDEFGNPNTAQADLTVELATSSVLSGTFRDAPDTTTLVTVTIAQGDSTASFRYLDTLAGSPVITAASGSLTPAVQAETITPAGASKLVFISEPITATAGITSPQVITVQRQDPFGNPNTAQGDLPVTLATSSVLSGTFVDVTGADALTAVTIAQGDSIASFRYRDELAGSPTITASSGALTPAVQTGLVEPAGASKLVFTSPPFTATAGVTSTQVITVQRQDLFGNPNTAEADLPLTLTTSSVLSGAFVDVGETTTITSVTIAQDDSTASFRYRDELAGSPIITAAGGSLTPAVQAETILPATAATLQYATDPYTVTAGTATDVIVVERRDQFGNLTDVDGTVTVTLTSDSPAGQFLTPDGGGLSLPTELITDSLRFRYRDTVAGSPTVTVVSGGAFDPITQTHTVLAGAPVTLAVGGLPAQIAGIAQTLTITAFDSFGNVAASYDGPRSLRFSGALTSTFGYTPSVTDNISAPIVFGNPTDISFSQGVATGSGGANGAMTLYAAQTAVISVTDIVGNLHTTPGTVLTVTVTASSTNQVAPETLAGGLGITQPAQAITAGTGITVYAVTRDAWGNFTGDTAGDWGLLIASGGVTATDLVTATGGASAVFTGHLSGAAQITVAAVDVPVSVDSGLLTVVPGPAAYGRVETAGDGSGGPVAAQTITKDESLQVYSVGRDQFGNYVDSPSATWTFLNPSPSNIGALSPGTGASTTFDPKKVGTTQITFTVGSALPITPTGIITVDSGNPASVAVETLPNSVYPSVVPSQIIIAGAAITMYAVTRDAGDNLKTNVAADSWTFITQTGSVTNTDLVVSGDSKSAVFTGRLAGTAGISVTEGSLTSIPSGLLTVIPGPAVTVTVATEPDGSQLLTSRAISAGVPITLYAASFDAFGNFVDNVAADWAVISATGGVTTADLAPTAAVISAVFTGKLAGTGVISVTSGGLTPAPSGTLTVTAGAPAVGRVETAASGAGTAVPAQVLTSGQPLTVYAVRRDAAGNFVDNVDPDAWSLLNPDGDIAGADLADNGLSATFTAALSGTTQITFTSGGLPITPSGVITVTPGVAARLRLVPTTSSFTAGAAEFRAVEALDAAGNLAVGYAGDKVLVYSGANPSPNGTQPTVRDKDNVAVAFSTPLTVTFTAGRLTNNGADGGVIKLYAAETAVISVTDVISGLSTTPSTVLTVTVAADAANRLKITGSSAVTAGQPLSLTIEAKDAYGNDVAGYDGNQVLTFGGASPSPNGTQPGIRDKDGITRTLGVATTLVFTDGQSAVTGPTANGWMTLYAIETAVISASDGNLSTTASSALTVTVSSAAANRLKITRGDGLASPVAAGQPLSLTVQAKDAYGNSDAAYTGDKALTFGGAGLSPNATPPTVTDKAGAAVTFGSPVTLTFVAGDATAGPPFANGWMTLTLSQTAVISASDGTLGTSPSSALTVTVTYAAANRLKIEGNTAVTAGQPLSLTVRAKDPYGNDDGSFAGGEDLTFGGASPSPNGTQPGVRDNLGVTQTFGLPTTLAFIGGVATVSGGANGLATLYAAETAVITATGGGLSTTASSALTVTVSAPLTPTLAGPTSIVSNTVSGPYTLTVTDGYGNRVLTNTTFALSEAPANGQFSSDSGGTNVITSLTVVANAESATFYYRHDEAEGVTVTATRTAGDSLAIDSAQLGIAVAAGP